MPARLTVLRDAGFDESRRVGTGRYAVRCSQCEAAVINGVACHESRCPNTPRDDDGGEDC